MKLDEINNVLGIEDSYKAPNRIMEILLGDVNKREKIFKEFLSVDSDLTIDQFHEYFQEEHAERKTKKQDFTPSTISQILTRLTESQGDNGLRYEVACGTGSIVITKWNADRISKGIFKYKPSQFIYYCEELSDRTIPFLLFNLMIRGMNAVVLHGDSITREFKQIYLIQNDGDDHMKFSSLNIMPHSKDAEKYFNVVKWTEDYNEHTESKWVLDLLKEV